MPSRIARHALLLLALLASAPLSAGAQPRVVAAAPAPLPVVVRDSLFHVVLLTRASAVALADSGRMSAYFGVCRNTTVLRADDSLAVIRSRLWDWDSAHGADLDHLTVLVTRVSDTEVECGARGSLRATALARGFRVTRDVAYPYGTAISAITVHHGSRVILPEDVERIPTSRITARGLLTIDGDMVRITVPLDSLAPAASGRVEEMEIEVTTPDSARSHRIRVPWTAMQSLWEQVLDDRAARLDAASATESRRLVAQLAGPDGSAERTLDARVALGVSLGVSGDVAAARAILGRAVGDEPCLTLSGLAPVAAREIVAALTRPPDRCRASIPRALLQSTLLPGLGQTTGTGRKVIGALVLGAVAGTLVLSQRANDDAKTLYAEYLTIDGLDPADAAASAASAYDRAESRRLAGRRLVLAGATLWGASIAEATWTEWRLSRRLQRVQGYDVRGRSVSAAVRSAPGHIGLALNLF